MAAHVTRVSAHSCSVHNKSGSQRTSRLKPLTAGGQCPTARSRWPTLRAAPLGSSSLFTARIRFSPFASFTTLLAFLSLRLQTGLSCAFLSQVTSKTKMRATVIYILVTELMMKACVNPLSA